MSAVVLAISMSLWPAAALEDETRWRTAMSYIEAFRYDDAYAELQRLLDADLSKEERARVLVWLGRIDVDLRREDDARAGFRRALETDSAASLPDDAPPRTRALFAAERVRARERAAERSALPPDGSAPRPTTDTDAQKTTTVAPTPAVPLVQPGPKTTAPERTPAVPEPPPPLSPATMVVGGGAVVVAVGLVVWGVGVGAYLAAEQSDAGQVEVYQAGQWAAAAQWVGQGATITGLLVAAAGGVLLLVEQP